MDTSDIYVAMNGDYSFFIGYLGKEPFFILNEQEARNSSIIENFHIPLHMALKKKTTSGYSWENNTYELFIEWYRENVNNFPPKDTT